MQEILQEWEEKKEKSDGWLFDGEKKVSLKS